MKVTLNFDSKQCVVEREKKDPRFRSSGWGSGESRLLYHVKKTLNAQGWDFIKKRMCKDGHMVSEEQQYLRERKIDKGCCCHWAIWNPNWAVEGAEESFKENGRVVLSLTNIGKSKLEETKQIKKLRRLMDSMRKEETPRILRFLGYYKSKGNC